MKSAEFESEPNCGVHLNEAARCVRVIAASRQSLILCCSSDYARASVNYELRVSESPRCQSTCTSVRAMWASDGLTDSLGSVVRHRAS